MKLVDIIPYLEGLSSRVNQKVKELNLLRKDVGLPNMNYETHIRTIQRQQETANKPFTIAFVGMFNSGKSTVINSILELKADKRLSDKDSPDTAKSIRLRFKEDLKTEALVHFSDGTSEEYTWVEAKNFTSQVYLDEHPELKAKADKIIEVEYFVNHPILRTVDFLDLPGTGTKNWRTHTHLTHERLKEAELVFWVMGTCAPEPSGSDLNDLKILKEVRSNVVPLINVWSDEEEGITGIVSAEDLENAIKSNLGAFFSPETKILKYYAREIDKAKQSGEPLKKEWGFEEFNNFLLIEYLDNFDKKAKEKIRRISGSVSSSLDHLMECVASDLHELEIIEKNLSELDQNLQEEKNERIELRLELLGKLRELAGERTQEMVDRCISASNAFIDDQMQLSNIEPIIDKIMGEDVAKKLSQKFQNDYLNLNQTPNWLEELLKDYLEDAKIIVESRWKRFIKDFNDNTSNKSNNLSIPTNFTDKILNDIVNGLISKGLILTIMGVFVYLLFIPGGQLIEIASLVALMAVNLFYDVLEKRRETAKLRARAMISNQKYELKNTIADVGMELHNACDKNFDELLKQKELNLSEKTKKIHLFKEILTELESDLKNAKSDIEEFAKGGG